MVQIYRCSAVELPLWTTLFEFTVAVNAPPTPAKATASLCTLAEDFAGIENFLFHRRIFTAP